MKKMVNMLLTTYILLVFYLTKNSNILALTISFSMYILFYSVFSTTSIKNVIEGYQNKRDYYSRDKVFLYTLACIIFIGVIMLVFSFFIGKLLNIYIMWLINIIMSISVISNIILKLITEYLNVIGYKKVKNLSELYSIVVITADIILSILLFKVLKLDVNINIVLLYSVNVIVFVFILMLFYFLVFYKKNKYKIKNKKNKINFVNDIKNIIFGNQKQTILNVINSTYIYVSIIILYYVLLNKYNYNYLEVGKIITSTFFYGFIIMFFIYHFTRKYLNIDYKNIKEKFNSNLNKIIKVSLHLCILLVVLCIPISNLLVNNNYNIISYLITVFFFYIIYMYIIDINMLYNKEKNILIILIMGLIIKLVFELPFINSAYRMGYSFVLGSCLSTTLGLMISIILGMIFIKKKLDLNLLNNFNNILNIIYEAMVYSLILVLFTFVIKIDANGVFNNIFVIIFYIFLTILFHVVKVTVRKKQKCKNMLIKK